MDSAENLENNWLEEFSELKSIEESLICGICYEYMQTVVMTPCSHNYCSLCIRRYLNFKNECPACFNQVFDTDLRVNRALDNIKQHFLKVRDKLKFCTKRLVSRSVIEPSTAPETCTPMKSRIDQLISTPKGGNKAASGLENEEICTPISSSRVSQLVSSPQTPIRSGNKTISETDSTIQGESIENYIFSPSTSGIAPIFNPARNRTFYKKEESGPTVPCPVCSVDVSEKHINRHLDDCLKRENNTSGPVRTETKLKPIPKLVLNLMKDIELRKRLKEYGLSTVGDSKILKLRLNKFYILYNTERDKAIQRPIAEIVKQCEEEEQIEKKVIFPSSGYMLTFNKAQISKPVKGQNESYCEANKTNFNKLIEQVRNRKTWRKKVPTEEEESVDLTSPNEDLVSETATNISNDSDSGTSSLLPRYSNEGPMKCLENHNSGDEDLRESCPKNSETDSVLENNRFDDLTDMGINSESLEQNERRFRESEEERNLLFASRVTDTSNDKSLNLNKRTATKNVDKDLKLSHFSNSNLVNFEKVDINRKGFVVKKPKLSKLPSEGDVGSRLSKILPDFQALDELLEDKEEGFKDISLDITDDSIDSNVAENIEETLESEMIKNIEESLLGLENGDKENEPVCPEEEKVTAPRSARKRGRPSRCPDDGKKTPTKSNGSLQHVLHESSTFETTLDESLDEVESSPEKILKRRKGRSQANPEPETPQRVLRRRVVGESSKRGVN